MGVSRRFVRPFLRLSFRLLLIIGARTTNDKGNVLDMAGRHRLKYRWLTEVAHLTIDKFNRQPHEATEISADG
jgi:hypothetical protein